MTHGDIKENVSGCFFLNAVYYVLPMFIFSERFLLFRRCVSGFLENFPYSVSAVDTTCAIFSILVLLGAP